MRERFEKIVRRWFVTEPALFAVVCSHEIEENRRMRCPLRSGRGRIEFSPDLVREMSDDALEEALRTEVIRIMLKHPYERRPDGCTGEAMATGSDLTVSDNYRFSRFSLPSPEDLGFESGLPYEAYSKKSGEGDGEWSDSLRTHRSGGRVGALGRRSASGGPDQRDHRGDQGLGIAQRESSGKCQGFHISLNRLAESTLRVQSLNHRDGAETYQDAAVQKDGICEYGIDPRIHKPSSDRPRRERIGVQRRAELLSWCGQQRFQVRSPGDRCHPVRGGGNGQGHAPARYEGDTPGVHSPILGARDSIFIVNKNRPLLAAAAPE